MVTILTVRESLEGPRAGTRGFDLASKGAGACTRATRGPTERVLGGALQGRLAVQAAHEYFERQGRHLEVRSEQLEVGTGLLGAGDRQLHGPQGLPDIALQRPGRPPGEALAAPGLADLSRELQEPGDHGSRHLARLRL